MNLKYASGLHRFASFVLDTIIALPIYVLFVMLGTSVMQDELLVKGIYNVLFLVFLMVCWIIFKGQTPGQMIMKTKIVDFETGNDITISQTFLRMFGYLLCNFMFGLGFLVMFFRKDKRALHDLISYTAVIYVGKNNINQDFSENITNINKDNQ